MDREVAAPDKIEFNNKFYGTEHLPSYHSAVQSFVGDDWTLVVTPGAVQHEAMIWPLRSSRWRW